MLFTYGGCMESSELIDAVRNAQADVDIKEANYQDGIGDRDRAIVTARNSGASVIEIAAACGLSRQQVHKIVANHADLPETQI